MTNKLHGYEFYQSIGSPKFLLAPMVDQSELAWRLLSRNYGAELTFTPMFHAANFIRDKSYRKEAMQSSPFDRPLIYQFCSNDVEIFCQAAKLVEDCCDAVDLNLGCPQGIAKKGHYGSYLQEDWELISQMLTKCVKELKVPVTAKIRSLSTIEQTVKYAQMIESCGISMLTIHGRTREQKGIHTGLADWNVIKAVKDSLKIPVIANGNIQYFKDIVRCFEFTGADGVMSAEGHLHNPAIFKPDSIKFIWDMASEYLELARLYPCNISYSRGHVFKLLHHALHCHPNIRDLICASKNVDELLNAVKTLQSICGPEICQSNHVALDSLPLKHWICQPYIRPPPTTPISDIDERTLNETGLKTISTCKRSLSESFEEPHNHKIARCNTDSNFYPSIDMKKSKEQRAEEKRKKKEARELCKENRAKKSQSTICESCLSNMRGLKCDYRLCKVCCKLKKVAEQLTCLGHS